MSSASREHAVSQVRVARRLAGIALVAVVTAGAFWAGRVTVQPSAEASELPSHAVTVAVAEQTVGRVLSLNVTVTQAKQALAVNALSGVVTATSKSGPKKPGAVLYRVGAIPVRAVRGSQPFYRALVRGDSGTDVRQLRGALVDLKFLLKGGRYFDAATERAVKAWQKQLGIPQNGRVQLGELVAVRRLPGSVLLDAKALVAGSVLHGGEKVVYAVSGQPEFALVISRDQASLIPETATVQMMVENKNWAAVVTDSRTTENGDTKLVLSGPDGGPVCGGDCDLVSGPEEKFFLAQVQVVPPATGPAVPVAAITTDPDGSTRVQVVAGDGSRITRVVKVLGSQDGVAVVEGVRVGETVQVIGSAAPATPQAAPTR